MTIQQKIIKELSVKPTINPNQEIKSRITFLKDYLKSTNAKGYVLGISGGQDSTLAGKLAQLAVEELRSEGVDVSFTAVRLPYASQKDEEDAQLALQFINPDNSIVFNVFEPVVAIEKEYLQATGSALSDFHKGNVKARARMIAQYAIGGMGNLLVLGTDHAAEALTGFFTKYGDGGADLLPLSGLNKRQGKELLKDLGAPEKLYLKSPTADLLDGNPQQSDEHELGITYDQLDDYLEGKQLSEEMMELIEERYVSTEHKRQLPVTPFDEY